MCVCVGGGGGCIINRENSEYRDSVINGEGQYSLLFGGSCVFFSLLTDIV